MAESTGPGPAALVLITGLAVLSGCGRGTGPLAAAAFAGTPAFAPVTRFDVSRRRARVAAECARATNLVDELVAVITEASDMAGLTPAERADCPLLLAGHADPKAIRSTPSASGGYQGAGALAATVAAGAGLRRAVRAYTTGCVAASSALADAATMIRSGRVARVIVAAGYLVDADYFALFDAGGALADDGRVRPFSTGRRGFLLGDAVVAVVLESAREKPALAELVGWGRAGDAHHVCQPRPDGTGLARAIRAALGRAGLRPADICYVNANGSASVLADAAESAALRLALAEHAAEVPVSSTKSVHGHALEGSALLELVVTVLALRTRKLPVNAGFLGADEECPLNLVHTATPAPSLRYALSLNSAFGGANTALVVGAG